MRPEDRLRARCRLFLDGALLPPCFYTAIEHGLKMRGTQEERERAWGRLKAQGVKTGLADLFVWAPGYFHAIELKSGKNDTTDAQDVFRDALKAMGHGYEVARSVTQLGDALAANLIPLAANWRIQAAHHDAALAVDRPAKKARTPRANPTRPTRQQVAKIAGMRARTLF